MKKILVIDAEAKIAQVLRLRLKAAGCLKAAGYEVLSAHDEVGALSLTLEWEPDLVVLDISVPVEAGFAVAHRLREQAPAVPLLLITGSTEEGLEVMAEHPRGAGFIVKPYEPEVLLAAVAQALHAAPASPPRSPDPSQPPAPAGVPASAADHSRPSPPDAPKPPATITGRHKILIVEDDVKITLALATRLRAAGQDVVLAYDALQALEMALKTLPDLVLLDIGLPCGNGLVVAERIQNLMPKYTPIIFLTASRQPGLRHKAMALGAVGFLEKPYDAGELLATIQHALNP
jgi:DNA-binding response OmpR family regulator